MDMEFESNKVVRTLTSEETQPCNQLKKEVFPVKYIMHSSQGLLVLVMWIAMIKRWRRIVPTLLAMPDVKMQLLWHGWVLALAHTKLCLVGGWGRICTKTIGWGHCNRGDQQVTAPCNHPIQDRSVQNFIWTMACRLILILLPALV